MTKKIEFKPRARLLLQLGDQLIKSESIAVLEIIKNSYDANASRVDVSMKDIEKPEKGAIIIEDDGDGMDADIIQNVWMQPGSDYKVKVLDELSASGHDKNKKRLPIGGKGIGRFGVHKLGRKIELISKRADCKEVKIEIDWESFEANELLKDVKVSLKENETPEYFSAGKTGTRIVITGLKSKWNRGSIRDLYRAITSLNSPFDRLDSFKTYFKLDNQDWLNGLVRFESIKDYALYYAEAEIEGDRIKQLKYEFRPWDTMPKLEKRTKIHKDLRMVREGRDPEQRKKIMVPIDLSKYKIGRMKFKILMFDRTPKILSLGSTDPKGLKEYLDVSGGVRVFRSDIRVYDYGEHNNDWLNLDLMRVNQPGKKISNNLIIGAVDLQRLESSDLIEKTNREGFIENDAYNEFVAAIQFTLDKILTERNIDKEFVRANYSPSAVSEPVIGHLKTLQDSIEEKIEDGDFKQELLRTVRNIERDYEQISEIYTRSSSAGLSLSIVIHEIIHMISELALAIEKDPTDKHVKQLIKSLQKTVGDYAGVIKQSNKSRCDLIKVVRQSLSNIKFRLQAHDVELISKYEEKSHLTTQISCAQNLVMSTIINIVDNAIWWQTYAEVEKKKIYVDILDEGDNHISVLIADNGRGFTIPPQDAVKPFISDKVGGMGLGLHLADEVMRGHKGRLLFPEVGEIDLPAEFKAGAKILLSFRKPA